MIITERDRSLDVFAQAGEKNMSIAIFCTASHWNTEAILLAAQKFARAHNKESVPVVVANTFTYPHMPQAKRFSYSNDAIAGFLAHMGNLKALAEGKYAPYRDVMVLPHLDHANPERDRWALTVGVPYFSSVMFDCQEYDFAKNMEWTKEYVRCYGDQVLVEGIMELLNVEGGQVAKHVDNYCERAAEYVKTTGVDFFVADLGTEQQTTAVGGAKYDKARARKLTEALGRQMLVLHGTSCLTTDQVRGLAEDGVIRVNMWTRIAREAGQYAAEKLIDRIADVRRGEFNAAEANAYIRDNVEKAADIMVEMMELYGYANW
ncbi:MAG: class II fructose-bisphosphate aldolase [Christensenellales bacterium]|jgi:fructose/tagatose bisphosphate aldolase